MKAQGTRGVTISRYEITCSRGLREVCTSISNRGSPNLRFEVYVVYRGRSSDSPRDMNV